MAWRGGGHGSRWPQLEAERSHPQPHIQNTEHKLEVGRGYLHSKHITVVCVLSKAPHPQALECPKETESIRDLVFKEVTFMGMGDISDSNQCTLLVLPSRLSASFCFFLVHPPSSLPFFPFLTFLPFYLPSFIPSSLPPPSSSSFFPLTRNWLSE